MNAHLEEMEKADSQRNPPVLVRVRKFVPDQIKREIKSQNIGNVVFEDIVEPTPVIEESQEQSESTEITSIVSIIEYEDRDDKELKKMRFGSVLVEVASEPMAFFRQHLESAK